MESRASLDLLAARIMEDAMACSGTLEADRIRVRMLCVNLELACAFGPNACAASLEGIIQALAACEAEVIDLALRAGLGATNTPDGLDKLSQVSWVQRRLLRVSDRALSDDSQHALDELVAKIGGGRDAALVGGSRPLDDLYHEELYPPLRLTFTPSVRSAEPSKFDIVVYNPSRRERIGSEIPSKVWPASVLLAEWLCQNLAVVQGKTCLELGAGMGVVGFTAGALGAQTVTMTDLDLKVLEHLRTNVRLNSGTVLPSATRIAYLDWARPPEDDEGGDLSADVILAADVINDRGLSDLVAAVVRRYLRQPGGQFIMIAPRSDHRHGVEEFEALTHAATDWDVSCEDVPEAVVANALHVAASSAGTFDDDEFRVLNYRLFVVRWREPVSTP